MQKFLRFLLVAFLTNAVAPATAWASQMEYKLTAFNKRLRSESVPSAKLTNTQQQTAITPETTEEMLKKEAQLCPLSRHAKLRALLYGLLEEFPLELIDVIIGYDNHLLTGKLQCTLRCPIQQTAPIIVSLAHSKNKNIFYAQTETGAKYWCNAATGVTSSAGPLTKTQKKKPAPVFLKAPKLVRSQALLNQAVVLPDGSTAHVQGSEITILSPKIDNQSTVRCTFKSGLVIKLLALPDGRLATSMFDDQIKLWT